MSNKILVNHFESPLLPCEARNVACSSTSNSATFYLFFIPKNSLVRHFIYQMFACGQQLKSLITSILLPKNEDPLCFLQMFERQARDRPKEDSRPYPSSEFLFLSCVNGPWHENVAVTKYVSCDTSRYASVVN